jgi:hypothetical protein
MRSGLASLFGKSGLLVTYFSIDFLVRETDVREKIIDVYRESDVGRMFAYAPDLFVMHPKKQYSDRIFFVKCCAIADKLAGLTRQELKALSQYPKDHIVVVVGQANEQKPALAAWLSQIDTSHLKSSIGDHCVKLSEFMSELGMDLNEDAYRQFCVQLSKLLE